MARYSLSTQIGLELKTESETRQLKRSKKTEKRQRKIAEAAAFTCITVTSRPSWVTNFTSIAVARVVAEMIIARNTECCAGVTVIVLLAFHAVRESYVCHHSHVAPVVPLWAR